MKDKMLLIKFDSNYADEFDVEGFMVMGESEWMKHITGVAHLFQKKAEAPLPDSLREHSRANREARQIEVYFGTNESMIFETFESYRDSFQVTPLSDVDYETLKRLFGKSYGPIRNGMVTMIDLEDPDLENEEEDEDEET